MDSKVSIFIACLACFVVGAWHILQIGSRDRRLPPGPPTLPVLGNLLDVPAKNAHLMFTELGRKYGSIVSLKLFNKTMVILNDAKSIRELMDTRAKSSSNRPPMHVAGIHISEGRHPLLADGPTIALMKKTVFNQALSPSACESYQPHQHAEGTAVLYNVLNNPEGFYQEMRRYSGSLTLAIAFGKRAPTFERADQCGFSLKRFFDVQLKFNHMLEAGATPPMDLLPWLTRLPKFMQTWQSAADEIKSELYDLYVNCLFRDIQQRVITGGGNHCWMEDVLQQHKAGEVPFDEAQVAWMGGGMLEAGSDTTSSALLGVVLAAVLHPNEVAKCQAEIDQVTNGSDRSPILSDIDKLPYTSAFLLEVQRWRPTANSGVPHYTTQAEEYNGYEIPAGVILVQNTWGVLHDERIYESPDAFLPERFIKHKHGLRDGLIEEGFRNTFGFGSGRRFCGGMKLAQNSLDITVMKMFWAFDFAHAVDANGQIIPVSADDYIPGHLTAPQPFKCAITVRSPAHEATIQRDYEQEAPYYEAYNPY